MKHALALALAGCFAAAPAAAAAAAVETATPPAPRLVRLPGVPTAATTLAASRGGSDAAAPSSQAVLNGRISDTQAVNTGSGNNLIAGGALAGMSGLPVVIQNSGNNVLIQNATIVNVTIK